MSFLKLDHSQAWILQNRKITRINYKRKLTDFKVPSVLSPTQMMAQPRSQSLTSTTGDKLWRWDSTNPRTHCRRFSNHKRTRRIRISLLEQRSASQSQITRATKILTVPRKIQQALKFAAGGISTSKVPTWKRPSNQNHQWLPTPSRDHSMWRSSSSCLVKTSSKFKLNPLSKLNQLSLAKFQILICKSM